MSILGIVLDWAGTTVDHGSCAPATVFQEIFRRREVPITVAQARGPMGMAKREHIQTITQMADVANRWQERYGTPCGEGDIDAMYEDFLPLQKEVLSDHCVMIDGVAEMAHRMRSRGIQIGSSTGYTRALMEIVEPKAAEQGYEADFVLCAEDAPRGRPAPFLLFEAAKRMDIFPMYRIVKIDDTPAGIEAGKKRGMLDGGHHAHRKLRGFVLGRSRQVVRI